MRRITWLILSILSVSYVCLAATVNNTQNWTIQTRRDTGANWQKYNPVLAQGEEGIKLTGNPLRAVGRKVGDGVTPWLSLPWFQNMSSGGVSSAAYQPTSAFATAAQGVKADGAVSLTGTQTITGAKTFSNHSSVYYGDGSHLTGITGSGGSSTNPAFTCMSSVAPAPHSYARITINANNGSVVWNQITDIQLRGVVGGSNLAIGGTATASTTYDVNIAANAFDGNPATGWNTTYAAPQWLQYHFPSPVSIAEWTVRVDSSDMTRSPRDMQLQVSDDGSNWTTVDTRSGVTGWTSGVANVFDLPTWSGTTKTCTATVRGSIGIAGGSVQMVGGAPTLVIPAVTPTTLGLAKVATSGNFNDLTNKPSSVIPAGGGIRQALTKNSNTDGDVGWGNALQNLIVQPTNDLNPTSYILEVMDSTAGSVKAYITKAGDIVAGNINSSGGTGFSGMGSGITNLNGGNIATGTINAARLPIATDLQPGAMTAADHGKLTTALQTANNLSDLNSASAARTNLGLGGAATLSVGTTAGTVAAGDDSRIVAGGTALQTVMGAGAKCDVKADDNGASITSGSTALTLANQTCQSPDVGKTMVVLNAGGGGGANLVTTVTSCGSGHIFNLAAAAGTTVSGVRAIYGTNDSPAIQSLITNYACTGYGCPGLTVEFPQNNACFIGSSIDTLGKNNIIFKGNAGKVYFDDIVAFKVTASGLMQPLNYPIASDIEHQRTGVWFDGFVADGLQNRYVAGATAPTNSAFVGLYCDPTTGCVSTGASRMNENVSITNSQIVNVKNVVNDFTTYGGYSGHLWVTGKNWFSAQDVPGSTAINTVHWGDSTIRDSYIVGFQTGLSIGSSTNATGTHEITGNHISEALSHDPSCSGTGGTFTSDGTVAVNYRACGNGAGSPALYGMILNTSGIVANNYIDAAKYDGIKIMGSANKLKIEGNHFYTWVWNTQVPIDFQPANANTGLKDVIVTGNSFNNVITGGSTVSAINYGANVNHANDNQYIIHSNVYDGYPVDPYEGSFGAISDNTNNLVTTSAKGFAPKLPNDATKYLDGTGAWSVPSGIGGSMMWPSGPAGIPNYNGSSGWGTSYSASNQIPFNFIAGVQAAGSYLTSESDPKIGSTTSGNFCKGTGTQVSCTDGNTYLTSAVTSVSSSNADISVATGTTTPVLTVNTGQGANKIVKQDANSAIGVQSGSAIVLSGTFSVSQSSTGLFIVTGLGSSLTTQASVGDTIAFSGGTVRKITRIIDDTHLEVDVNIVSDFTGNTATVTKPTFTSKNPTGNNVVTIGDNGVLVQSNNVTADATTYQSPLDFIGTNNRLDFKAYGGANTFAGSTAGGSTTTPSATPSGAQLFTLAGYGMFLNGSSNLQWANVSKALIMIKTTEAWTSAAQGTDIEFQTTGTGTTTRAERMRIQQGVSIGSTTDPGAGNLSVSGSITNSVGTVSATVASGTATLGTSAIASGACATAVSSAGSGIATTDVIDWTPNAPIRNPGTGVNGYIVSTTGGLDISAYPTSGYANFLVCNPTTYSITPGAVTINWRVRR